MYERATVTTVTNKESYRESKSNRESKRKREVRKRSKNRDSDRHRKRETHRDGDGKLYYCFFVYPGLLLAILAIVQTS